MRTADFQIEFTWQDMPYIGIVKPVTQGNQTKYIVSLESENQETYLDLTLKPSASELKDWDFICGDDEDAAGHFDPELLLEVAEAIEKHLAGPKYITGINSNSSQQESL